MKKPDLQNTQQVRVKVPHAGYVVLGSFFVKCRTAFAKVLWRSSKCFLRTFMFLLNLALNSKTPFGNAYFAFKKRKFVVFSFVFCTEFRRILQIFEIAPANSQSGTLHS